MTALQLMFALLLAVRKDLGIAGDTAAIERQFAEQREATQKIMSQAFDELGQSVEATPPKPKAQTS